MGGFIVLHQNLDGTMLKRYDERGNNDLRRYQQEIDADPATLRLLIETPDSFAQAITALGAAVDWAQGATGEIWLVMCSCHELCEPERFDPMNAASIAKLGRLIGETVSEI